LGHDGGSERRHPRYPNEVRCNYLASSKDGLWRESKYCPNPDTFLGLILLLNTRNGEPLLQHMRVGGGSGIGAKHLARKDASSVGILGSGAIARTCLEALQVVRPIKEPLTPRERTFSAALSRLSTMRRCSFASRVRTRSMALMRWASHARRSSHRVLSHVASSS
jgi:hypothetical protein